MMTFVRPVAMKRVPTVTVVVPCYNYGHYLAQQVAMLLDQPDVEVDVLIVDDASPDGSGTVAASLAAEHPQVTVLQHETNKGHIRTYNDGLAAATGEYVALLSADDLLPSGALGRAVSLMEAHPSVGMVYGYAQTFSGDAPEVEYRVRNWSVWAGFDWLQLSLRQGRCLVVSPEVVMRREALRQAGDYDNRLPHSGDFDMWLRTSLNWDIGRINGPPQALYRVHDGNMHLTTYAGMLTDLVERAKTIKLLFDEHATTRHDVHRLRGVAMRALAEEALKRGLTAYRDSVDPDLVTSYLAFAEKTDETIRASAWWRMYRAGPVRGTRFPAVRARQFASKARHHVQWRLERRYGI